MLKTPAMKDKEKTLIQFAEFVLMVLETDKEWNADTIDDIGAKAFKLGLATTNEDGEFVRK